MPSSTTSGRALRLAVALAVLLAGFGGAAPAAQADGVDVAVSVIKCQFSDNARHDVAGSPVNTDQQIADFLINHGTGGLADYYAEVSGGRITFGGSDVSGWFTLPTTLAEDSAPTTDRGKRVQDCAAAAQRAGWTLPAGHRLIVFRNQCVDGGSWGGVVLIDPCSGLAFTAHELGHALGREHSMSDDSAFRLVWWSGAGEYDDEWDLMSALHVFRGPGTDWTSRPVGYNAFHLAALGLMPASRILAWPARSSGQATLTPLYGSPATATAPMVVKVPLPSGGPYEYLTVEYRAPQGLDAPIGPAVVQIHGIRGNRSWLLRVANGRRPTQHVVIGTTAVDVTSTGGPTATLAVDTGYGLPRVPAVIGSRATAATTTLQDAGLTVVRVNRTEAVCDHIGEVIEQTPAAGAIVDPGSQVTVTVAVKPRGACL